MLGALLEALAAGSTKELARLTCPWKLGSCVQGALLEALAAGSTKAEVGKTNLPLEAWILRAGRTPSGPGSGVDQSGS